MIDVEDADARSADFISDLQSMIDSASAVGVDVPLADHTELRRWLAPRTVRRFAALWPPWRSRGPSALRRFGVAVQLMLMVQRAAVVLFALLSLSSVAALRENLKAHTEAGGQRARARILPRTRERARAQRIHPPPAAAAGDVDWDFGAQHNEYDDPPTYELYIATTTGYGMESVDVDAIRLQNYLGIVQVFVLILFLLWIRRVMRFVSWRTDTRTVTAADYTAMISGLRAQRDVQATCQALRELAAAEIGLSPEDASKIRVVIGVECASFVQLLRDSKAAFVDLKEAEARERLARGSEKHMAAVQAVSVAQARDDDCLNITIQSAWTSHHICSCG